MWVGRCGRVLQWRVRVTVNLLEQALHWWAPEGRNGFTIEALILPHLASSCLILLYLAVSCLILPHLAISCLILQYLDSSCYFLPHLASSCLILLYLASSCLILLFLSSSCNILTHFASFASSCLILLYLASSYLILPHLASSCLCVWLCMRVTVNWLEHCTDEPQKGETASLLKPSAVTALFACMCGWVGRCGQEWVHAWLHTKAIKYQLHACACSPLALWPPSAILHAR